MTQQINPPYDGSPPCPGCNHEVRSAAAYIHNFLNRWPTARYPGGSTGRAIEKLIDLRESWERPPVLAVPHPDVTELMDVADALVAAAQGITLDGLTMRWTKEVVEAVDVVIPRALAASEKYSRLSDAHFHDKRHSSGEVNILREQRGSTFYDGAYDHTVEVVPEGGDIQHSTVCGTRLKLHEYFKADLRRDPLFFGKVWCPTCRGNVPFAQFTVISSLD